MKGFYEKMATFHSMQRTVKQFRIVLGHFYNIKDELYGTGVLKKWTQLQRFWYFKIYIEFKKKMFVNNNNKTLFWTVFTTVSVEYRIY